MKIEINKIYNMDCLEGMGYIEDKSIDMILCDLPYGTTACKWDIIIPFELLWNQYERIIKDNGAMIFTASQPFTTLLISSNLKLFRYEWIWQKNYGSNFAVARKQPFKEHENICVFYKKQPTYKPIMEERSDSGKLFVRNCKYEKRNSEHTNSLKSGKANRNLEKRLPGSIKKFNMEVGLHPTQKPVTLFEYLIKTYTNEGDLVLDNCIGSGTTAIACIKTGRNFIGFDNGKDTKTGKYWADIAIERIAKIKGDVAY